MAQQIDNAAERSGQRQPRLSDHCLYRPDGSRRPCFAQASLVLVRPSGETLSFTCAEHLPTWTTRIHGRYLVLERDEWEARGAGYRGVMVGASRRVGAITDRQELAGWACGGRGPAPHPTLAHSNAANVEAL